MARGSKKSSSSRFLTTVLEGRGSTVCGKTPPADSHPGAQGATPPESGGELFKTLPPSDEEWWRAERQCGAEMGIKGCVVNNSANKISRSLLSPAGTKPSPLFPWRTKRSQYACCQSGPQVPCRACCRGGSRTGPAMVRDRSPGRFTNRPKTLRPD